MGKENETRQEVSEGQKEPHGGYIFFFFCWL